MLNDLNTLAAMTLRNALEAAIIQNEREIARS